jgi:hypothetical protein
LSKQQRLLSYKLAERILSENSTDENEKSKFDFDATEEAEEITKTDYRFMDEIFDNYDSSKTNKNMLSDYIRLFNDRTK